MTDKISTTGFTRLRIGLCLLSLGVIMPSQAVTTEIGSGSQEWLGPAISGTLTGEISRFLNDMNVNYGFISIQMGGRASCLGNSEMTDINGIQALRIAQGVFLVPQASYTITYQLNSDVSETMSGSIGKPETNGIISGSGTGSVAAKVADSAWCMIPRAYPVPQFFKADSERQASVTGNWIIITDGSQQDGIYNVPSMIFASRMTGPSDSVSTYILSGYQIKVSTRQCSININNSIAFGEVEHNSAIGAELGRVNDDSFAVACSQSSVNSAANINVKFQTNSDLYDNEATRLPLNEGGGYITGEIAGIAGVDNGACNSTGGLKFNSDPIRLGSIGTGANSVNFPNVLTWRLCSGGDRLPVGNVTASATVDVIFN